VLAAAADYIARGFAVFLTVPNSKKPFSGSHGFLDATLDVAVFADMLARHPDADIAVATGTVSGGLAVVDFDTPTVRQEVEVERGTFARTPRVLTRRGEHLWYRSDRPLKGRNGFRLDVDVKGVGGFVCAPPSPPYRWASGASLADLPLAPLPQWIADELAAPTIAGPPPGEVLDSILGRAFHEAGWLGGRVREGVAKVRCPWESAHTCGRRYDGSSVLFGPAPGSRYGWFHCSHGHCAGRRQDEVLAALPGGRA
jgi:hypothetical protein